MNKPLLSTILLVITTLVLAACQMTPQASTPAAVQSGAAALATRLPALAPEPTAVPQTVPTQDPAAVQAAQAAVAAKGESGKITAAEQAARDYFAALEENDFSRASAQVSSFSLTVFGMTRGDASAALNRLWANGTRWSGLEIIDSQTFNDTTVLVHLRYTQARKDAQDGSAVTETREEMWPVRLENDTWRCNWDNLIDYHTLEVKAQTMNGLTIKPVQANRYSDHLQLLMLAQNRTNESIVLGQVNEVLGTFHFGDQRVEAEKTQIILNPMRSVPDMSLEVKGLFVQYPNSVELRKWKNYEVAPWYVFQLQ